MLDSTDWINGEPIVHFEGKMKLKELPNSLSQSLKQLIIKKEKLGYDAIDSDTKVIISLTSIPYRLPRLNLVIRSLLNQNRTFKKIILWLHTSLEESVPRKLSSLQSDRFEIRYSNSTSSHRKLVETLRVFPVDFIVTCDDDLMYPNDWLKRLLDEHYKHPLAIVAHACRVFQFNTDGKLAAYHLWEHEKPGQGSIRTLPIGYGGVLYPPNSLHSDTTDEPLFNRLAPKADDFWFKAMSLKQGTCVVNTSRPQPDPVPIVLTQKHSLKKSNIHNGGNREQWLNIVKHYNMKLLDTEL